MALGDLLLDVVVTADEPLRRGTDVPATIRFRQGGSAANVARAASRLGGRAAFIGSVGRDEMGRRLVAALRAEGVRVHVTRVPLATGRIAVVVERGGERSFLTQRAAANELTAAAVKPSWLSGCGALHLPAYSLVNEPIHGAAARAAGMAQESGSLVSVDVASLAPLLALGRKESWSRIAGVGAAILFANRDEALARSSSPDLARLLDLAPLVVIKEGVEGCRILSREHPGGPVARQVVATSPVAAADTTGAGDAFAAGFLRVVLDAGGAAARPWNAALLRRAALAGHRSAADLLRRPRAELVI